MKLSNETRNCFVVVVFEQTVGVTVSVNGVCVMMHWTQTWVSLSQHSRLYCPPKVSACYGWWLLPKTCYHGSM